MSLTCHVIGTYQGDHHIVCSAVSTCASWAAFSDVYHISLFKLNLVSKNFCFIISLFFHSWLYELCMARGVCQCMFICYLVLMRSTIEVVCVCWGGRGQLPVLSTIKNLRLAGNPPNHS